MNPADRISKRRKELGLDPNELGCSLGLNEAWYADIEAYEDELESTLTLRQALSLAERLDVSLHWLVFGDEHSGQTLGSDDIPILIEQHLKASSQSRENFENQIGWDLGDWSNPREAQLESSLIFLRDLAEGLGVSYGALLS